MSASARTLSSALAADLDPPPPAADYDHDPRCHRDSFYLGALVDGVEGGGWVGHNDLSCADFVVGIGNDPGANSAPRRQATDAVAEHRTAEDFFESIERKPALPHLTYWSAPVETSARVQRTSPARPPNDAAHNASETREDA